MSRAHRAASRRAHPYRPWIVWDEGEGALLVVARTESQARRVWREHMGLSTADCDPEDCRVRLAKWEWAAVPEPRLPQRPCVWQGRVIEARHNDLPAWRGYGLRDEDDTACKSCAGLFPKTHVDGEFCHDCASGGAS